MFGRGSKTKRTVREAGLVTPARQQDFPRITGGHPCQMCVRKEFRRVFCLLPSEVRDIPAPLLPPPEREKERERVLRILLWSERTSEHRVFILTVGFPPLDTSTPEQSSFQSFPLGASVSHLYMGTVTAIPWLL
jgi:hypothetical protein